MAKMKFKAPVTGVETWKYKTGASGGGFGTDAASQPSGAALTITDDNEVALSGANDPVDRILDTVNVNTGQCRVFNPNVGEIEGIITNGTLTVGSADRRLRRCRCEPRQSENGGAYFLRNPNRWRIENRCGNRFGITVGCQVCYSRQGEYCAAWVILGKFSEGVPLRSRCKMTVTEEYRGFINANLPHIHTAQYSIESFEARAISPDDG